MSYPLNLKSKKDVIQRQQNNKCLKRSRCFSLPHVNFENHILEFKKLGNERGGTENFLREGQNRGKLPNLSILYTIFEL